MSGAKHTPGPWTVRVWKKGKRRKAESINIGRSRPVESAGPYPSLQAAQQRCDELNNAIAKAEGRS